MDSKGSNRLSLNLPQLFSLIKKNPTSYHEEFEVQYTHFESVLRILAFNPSYFDKDFETLVIFISQTIHYYDKKIHLFLHNVTSLLRNFSTSLHRSTRIACCKALMILRSNNIIQTFDILPIFFELSRCQDKNLRSFVRHSIINDIKTINKHSRNDKINKQLQRCMFVELSNEQQETSAKLALDIMIELYKKQVWRNQELVNRIADGCLSRSSKILIASLQFFLGTDEKENDDDEDSEQEEDKKREALNNLRKSIDSNKWNKSTRKRQKILNRIKKTVKTHEMKEKKVANFNFSALHMINNPQELAEKLLSNVEKTSEKFEYKLMMINLISRLIGVHELVVLNFYPYISKFIHPHQCDVTKILQYSAQASHKNIPPDELVPVLKAMVENFVSEHNSTEAITVGLNAIRELCARNPLVMSEDILQDLAQYQKYKNKNVSIAAKSLINLFRVKNPSLLSRKDRGRPMKEAESFKALQFGEVVPYTEDSEVEMETDQVSDYGSENDSYVDDEEVEEDEEDENNDEVDELKEVSDRVRLEDIERIYKRPRDNKESRLATVLEGREGRGKYGRPEPKPNQAKKKTKAFGMIKHKLKRHKKVKSFQQKQLESKQKSLNARKRK